MQLVAAPFTPFTASGELAPDVVDEQAAALRRLGVDGVFVAGTTGEGMSLTLAERTTLAERWVRAADGLRVIVHVGHAGLRDARALASHAADAGAHAVAAVPPFYQRPRTADELADCCAEVASAAPGVPFLYYHIPSLTGVTLPMASFLPVAAERIPNLGGVKFTDSDLFDYAGSLDAAGDRHEVYFGRDEQLLGTLAHGATAAVGSTYNLAAPMYRALATATTTGELPTAQRLQRVSRTLVTIAERYGGLPALKALASARGPDLGPCRPPLRTLPADATSSLVRTLETAGVTATLEAYS